MSVKSRKKEKWFVVIVLFFTLAIAGSGIYGFLTQKDRPKVGAIMAIETEKAKKVQLAPVTFVDDEGKPVRLDDFKGDVLLVNLWATWCTPCVAELPELDRLQGKLKDNHFKVVAISMDRDDPKKVKKFLEDREADNLEFFWDRDRELASKWSYAGLPTSYLVSREGDILARWDGPQAWMKGDIYRKIKAALQ